VYDLRLQDNYHIPLLKEKHQVDLSALMESKFASDLFLAEEVGEEEENSEERVLKLRERKGEDAEKTKEYIDFGFKVQLKEDGGVGIKMESEEVEEQKGVEEQKDLVGFSIYDDRTLFVAP